MPWMVTVWMASGSHAHVDVADPAVAAMVINTINDAIGMAVNSRIETWSNEWSCGECGTWRLDPNEGDRAKRPIMENQRDDE